MTNEVTRYDVPKSVMIETPDNGYKRYQVGDLFPLVVGYRYEGGVTQPQVEMHKILSIAPQWRQWVEGRVQQYIISFSKGRKSIYWNGRPQPGAAITVFAMGLSE